VEENRPGEHQWGGLQEPENLEVQLGSPMGRYRGEKTNRGEGRGLTRGAETTLPSKQTHGSS